MDLSMWILLDELADFHPWAEISGGARTIEGFRLLSPGEARSAALMYVGNREFSGGEAVTLSHGGDSITIDNADMPAVLNRLIGIFDKYNRWDRRLNAARHASPNGYQAVLDAAHEIFQCPMFFGNKNLHIYAVTAQYGADAVYDEWEDVKAFKTMPFSFLERMKAIKMPRSGNYSDDIDPAVFPVWEGMRFEHQIRSNCYYDGKVWGHFYLYYNKKTVTQALLQLARHVADIFSQMLQERQETGGEKYSMYSWLVDILNTQSVPTGAIQSFYWMMKWAENDTLSLFRVAPSETGYDRLLYDWLCDSISALHTGAVVFPHNDTIVVIVRHVNSQEKLILEGIGRLISVNGYRCGVSFAFKGLQSIGAFYKQAGYAIRFAPDSGNKVHYFRDCALEGLAGEMKLHLSWRAWVPPSLLKLAESDLSQGTEYYATLYHLLVNKWHIGNTAKALYIHRNTLLYRLEKIENLLDIDIHSESMWSYLRLCYAMMADEYPVSVAPKDGAAEKHI